MLLSQLVPTSPPPPTMSHAHKSLLYVCLYSCPENRLISTIFLVFINMPEYTNISDIDL